MTVLPPKLDSRKTAAQMQEVLQELIEGMFG